MGLSGKLRDSKAKEVKAGDECIYTKGKNPVKIKILDTNDTHTRFLDFKTGDKNYAKNELLNGYITIVENELKHIDDIVESILAETNLKEANKQFSVVSEKIDPQDQRRLKGVLDNFLTSYKNLLRVWQELDDTGDMGVDDYPFKESFDEINIEKWVDTFKSEIKGN